MLIRAQVTLPYTSNIPKDCITNTWYFSGWPAVSFTDAADAAAAGLVQFYDTVYVTAGCATYVNRGGAFCRCYDMSTPEPRVPYEPSFTLSTANTQQTAIPTEVACVLSFQADKEAGEPQARRRGRIYLGGVTNGVGQWIGNNPSFPVFDAVALNAITSAAEDLADLIIGEEATWVVYSPTNGTWAQVTNGWVDSSPDTQRRRSVEATSRTLWP